MENLIMILSVISNIVWIIFGGISIYIYSKSLPVVKQSIKFAEKLYTEMNYEMFKQELEQFNQELKDLES